MEATDPAITNHPLYPVFIAAIQQAMHGKGTRHGGAVTPFHDQPWAHYAKLHGRGFLTGQAAKKLEEAASKREGVVFDAEVLGAIVYCGMAVLHERAKSAEKMRQDVVQTVPRGPTLADLAGAGIVSTPQNRRVFEPIGSAGREFP
jgi:hypothetical protein